MISHRFSEKFQKFGHAEASVIDDFAKQAALDVGAGMNGNDRSSKRIVAMLQNMMTAFDPNNLDPALRSARTTASPGRAGNRIIRPPLSHVRLAA
jgi:hypothetical protein